MIPKIAPLLVALLVPMACTPAVDERLRRIDLLDRVFEPERFRSPPPEPPPAMVAAVPEPVTPRDRLTATDAFAPPLAEPLPDLASRPSFDAPAAEREAVPPRDPALRQRALLRQQPWLSRFWSALTPAQQQRVQRRMPGEAEPAAAWDSMGLADRVTLVFGEGG